MQAGEKENILKNLNLFAEAAEKIKKAREEIRTADTLLKANLGDFLKIFDDKKDEFIRSLPLAANSSYYSKMVLNLRRQNFENLNFFELKMTVVNQNKNFFT